MPPTEGSIGVPPPKRDDSNTLFGSLKSARGLAEPLKPNDDPNKITKGGPGSGVPLGSPSRRATKASLVERDNDFEFLEFHWNPSTFRIRKSANWSDNAVTGGTPTVNYDGCSLTVVSFQILLNDIAPHVEQGQQKSVEDSLEWLFSRMRSRTAEDAARTNRASGRRGAPWLGVRDVAAGKSPPVLVLFGLSQPFECVLADATVNTIFQTPTVQEMRREVLLRTGQRNLRSAVSGVGGVSNFITRATVDIELKEHINSPEVAES